jgi:hypothetical protein
MNKKTLFLVAVCIIALIYWGGGFYLSPLSPRVGFDKIFENTYDQKTENAGLNYSISDAENLYVGNRCFLKGENPLPVMLQKENLPENDARPIIGNVPYLPWSYVVGNIFVPAFLSLKNALVWMFVVCVLLYIWMCRKIYSTSNIILSAGERKDKYLPLLATVLCFAQYGYLPNLSFMNPSFFVIPLIVIAALYDGNKNALLVGTLFGIAMLKPQMAMLFFIPLLVNKQFKAISVGVLWVIIPWLAASFIYGENPLLLLLSHFTQSLDVGLDPNYNRWYMGLFDPLVRAGLSPSLVNNASMLFFMIATFVLCLYCKKRNVPDVVVYSVPAVFTLCWTYSTSTNIPVLALLIMAIIFTIAIRKMQSSFVKYVLIAGVIFLLLPVPEFIRYKYSPMLFPLMYRIILFTLLFIVIKYNSKTICKNCP